MESSWSVKIFVISRAALHPLRDLLTIIFRSIRNPVWRPRRSFQVVVDSSCRLLSDIVLRSHFLGLIRHHDVNDFGMVTIM